MMWWYGHPAFGGGFGGWWPLHFFGMGLFWLVLIAVLALPLTRLLRPEPRGTSGDTRSSALSILEERYARGEVGRDEYLEKKRDLSAQPR